MKLGLVVAVMWSLSAVQGQSVISVDETQIRAILQSNSTVVSIPVLNSSDQPVKVQLALEWLSTDDTASSSVREVLVQTGRSSIDSAAPLVNPS